MKWPRKAQLKAQFRQLGLLWKKNILLQSRHPWVTLFEFLLPAVLGGLLQIARAKLDPVPSGDVTVWKEFTPDYLNGKVLCEEDFYHLAYTPNTLNTTQIVENTADSLDKLLSPLCCPIMLTNLTCPNSTRFQLMPFETADELNDYVYTDESSKSIFMGFEFHDPGWLDDQPFPAELNYTMRPPAVPRSERDNEFFEARGWLTNRLYNGRPGLKGPRQAQDFSALYPAYYKEGFLTTQHLLDLNFMRLLATEKNVSTFDESEMEVAYQRFPYPPYSQDDFIPILGQNLPFVILLCMIYLAQRTARFVAVEKETGLKEYMMMMGLSRNTLWTSYFLHYYTLFLVSVSILTFVFCTPFTANGPIIGYSQWSVVWFFLMLYGTSLISIGFMVSTWFNSSSATAAATTVILFVMYSPFNFIANDLDGVSYDSKVFCSLSSPVAMALGCGLISSWESKAIGLQWGNLATRVSASDQLTMSVIFQMLILDTILYYVFARYVDLVKEHSSTFKTDISPSRPARPQGDIVYFVEL